MNNVAYIGRPERRAKNGRRCGDHGHRVPAVVERQVRQELTAAVRGGGRIPADVMTRAMELTGATGRTIQRWADEQRRDLIAALPAQSGPSREEALLGLQSIAAGQRPKFRVTRALVEEVAAYPSVAAAYAVLHDTPGHPVEMVSRSTFYAALADTHPAVRHGRTRGPRKMRQHEAHLQRIRRVIRINESWSTDEFDTKIDAEYQGRQVSPKVISFRDEATGLPVGYAVLPGAATSDDVVALFGSCVIGWTSDDVTVTGAPRRVHCDQGAPFLGADTRLRLSYCGTTLDPTASYNPQANGAQERFQRDLLEELKKVRGNRRAPKDRTGRPYADAIASFDEVVEAVDAVMAHQRFVHRPLTGRHARRTAFEVYRQHLADGRMERIEAEDAGIAETAPPLRGLRTVEPRKGVFLRGEYYTSYGLALWNREEDVQLRVLPGNPEQAFVFDTAGKFIATVWHPDALPAEDALAIVGLRKDREDWMHGVHTRRAAVRATTAGVARCDDGGVTVTGGTATPTTQPPAAPADPTALAHAPELRELLTNPALLTALRALSDEQLTELRAAVPPAPGSDLDEDETDAPAEPARAPHVAGTQPAASPAQANSKGKAKASMPAELLHRLNGDQDGDAR